jgi:hypothetical protein
MNKGGNVGSKIFNIHTIHSSNFSSCSRTTIFITKVNDDDDDNFSCAYA